MAAMFSLAVDNHVISLAKLFSNTGLSFIENWFTEKMSDYCPVKPSQNLKLKRTCEIAWQNFVVCSHRALHSCYKLALTWLLSKYWLVKLETPVIRAAILSQFTGSIGNAYWQPWKKWERHNFYICFHNSIALISSHTQSQVLVWKVSYGQARIEMLKFRQEQTIVGH